MLLSYQFFFSCEVMRSVEGGEFGGFYRLRLKGALQLKAPTFPHGGIKQRKELIWYFTEGFLQINKVRDLLMNTVKHLAADKLDVFSQETINRALKELIQDIHSSGGQKHNSK